MFQNAAKGALHQLWYRGAGSLSLNPPGKPGHPAPSPSMQGHLGNLGARAPPPSKGVHSERCWVHGLLCKTSEKTGLVQRDKWVFMPGTGIQVRVSLEPSLVPWAASNSRPGAEGPRGLEVMEREGETSSFLGKFPGDNGWGGAHERAGDLPIPSAWAWASPRATTLDPRGGGCAQP